MGQIEASSQDFNHQPLTLIMKKILILPFLVCSAQILNAQVITNFSSDFNTGPTATALANYKQADGSTSTLNWGATAGTGGTGGVLLGAGSINNFYRIGTGNTQTNFDFGSLAVGGTYSTSIDLRINTSVNDLTVATFGFTTNNAAGTLTSPGVNVAGGIVRNNSANFQLRMRSDSANVADLLFAQNTLTSNNWYQITLDLTKNATAGQFAYDLTLWSLGANGTSTPTIFNDGIKDIRLTGTLTNVPFYSTGVAQWAIDARNTAGNTGITALDNFNVVPEPSTGLLMLVGLAALAGRTRKRLNS